MKCHNCGKKITRFSIQRNLEINGIYTLSKETTIDTSEEVEFKCYFCSQIITTKETEAEEILLGLK